MRIPITLLALSFFCWSVFGATKPSRSSRRTPPKTQAVKRAAPAKSKAKPKTRSRPRARTVVSSPWKLPTFADSTLEDNVDGEDLDVRRAAVAALGPYNGAVVVTDPETGRVLSVVNQKLALSSGYQPCSTIKLVTTLAALEEDLIPQAAPFRLSDSARSSLVRAVATSTNGYFAALGKKLGFDRVVEYARRFGLGEKAGWNIPEEKAGALPSRPPSNGGVGMMTSFGTGISLTPLQLAAFVGAVANGGTLYYLQYPRTRQEVADLTPRVKRDLEIADWLDDLKQGMRAAVESGTARRAGSLTDEPLFGKTGTCTDYGKSAHMGWFGSFNEIGERKLVVVVMLTGARGVSGPIASGIAGRIYAELARQNYLVGSDGRVQGAPNS